MLLRGLLVLNDRRAPDRRILWKIPDKGFLATHERAFDGFEAPADRVVSLRQLHDAVAERADPDDGMGRLRGVAHQIKEVSARRRLVRYRPEITEVPPDVDQLV